MFTRCKKKMGIKGDIPIKSIECIEQPCIYGFFRPTVLLSNKCIDKLSYSQKEYICIHELSHYLRKDYLMNWLLITLRIVYWFNPIIGYALNRMKEDSELACDALALSYINSNEYKKYAMTIIHLLDIVLKTKYTLATVSIINGRKRVERRIKMICNFKNSTKLKKFTSCFIALVIVCIGAVPIWAFSGGDKTIEATTDNIANASNAPIDNSIMEMKLTWPVPGFNKITSNYGYRVNPTIEVSSDYCTELLKNGADKVCKIGNIEVFEPTIEQDKLNNSCTFHNGIDIAAPKGEKIVAIQEGTITYSGFDDKYGNMIIIKHGKDTYSIYAHCNKSLVKEKEEVTKGQEIAKVGSSGQSTGPHVHFSIVINNKIENPMEYLNIEELSAEDNNPKI